MTRWIHTGLGMVLGILIGLASGHFMPCYGAEREGFASAELVIHAVDHRGRHLWSRTQIFETYRACQIARTEAVMQYWAAQDNPVDPFRQGLAIKCFQRT